jgi:SAM-dependent methyltransferase
VNTVADAATRTLLERGAPLLRSISDALCRTPSGRDHCGALHGVWADLRLLGLAAEPSRHATFYSQALRERAADGASARVLVAGCADWGMLDTVAAAYRNAPLNATVVDRCATPVLACAWYGAETGLTVRTAVGDVADWGEAASFDLICTHSLLTYAALDGRRRLVANWQRLLRPGGVVVTVSRLATEPMSGDVDARARRFAELAVQRCKQTHLERDPTALRARAERFARAQVSHPVGTEADLRELFEEQGFAVTRLEVRQLEGTMGAREPVGGAARTGAYGEIVAVRR